MLPYFRKDGSAIQLPKMPLISDRGVVEHPLQQLGFIDVWAPQPGATGANFHWLIDDQPHPISISQD